MVIAGIAWLPFGVETNMINMFIEPEQDRGYRLIHNIEIERGAIEYAVQDVDGGIPAQIRSKHYKQKPEAELLPGFPKDDNCCHRGTIGVIGCK